MHLQEKRNGTFKCAGCGSPVYESQAKFDSGTGWPSFFQPIAGAVDETIDRSIPFVPRVEVRFCNDCVTGDTQAVSIGNTHYHE